MSEKSYHDSFKCQANQKSASSERCHRRIKRSACEAELFAVAKDNAELRHKLIELSACEALSYAISLLAAHC